MGFRLANVDGRAALVEGEVYYDLATVTDGSLGPDLMDVMGEGAALHAAAASLGDHAATGQVADVVLGPPVPNPQKSFGIGLNYLEHANEGGMELPENPLVFTKFPSCIVGPTADVEMRSDFVDYEAELVVVIGEGGKDIAEADAWGHVLGFTIGQDISDRPAQFASKPPHFDLGKSFDTFGPLGPYLVSLDLLDYPASLWLKCDVAGELRQDDNTKNLIFDIPKLISYLSHITTLVPGDIIWTGTPEGIGFAQGKLLKDGEVITTSIEGLGEMVNRCVRVSDYQ